MANQLPAHAAPSLSAVDRATDRRGAACGLVPRARRSLAQKERSKNHRAHWVALSRQVLALLRGQDTSRELIFGTATDTGVQAWLRRWCERERISPAFRPHDLRRTCATRLNTLGVLPHITEKILNHTMQRGLPR
jgi:integrase